MYNLYVLACLNSPEQVHFLEYKPSWKAWKHFCVETVTFNRFGDFMGGRFFHDINHNVRLSEQLAAVFIDPCSLAVGAEYEILQFLVVESTLLTLCSNA